MTRPLHKRLLWVADLTARQFTLTAKGDHLHWTVAPQFAKSEPDLCRVIVEALRVIKADVLPVLADPVFVEFVALARRVHTDRRQGFVDYFCQRTAAQLATGKGHGDAKRLSLEECCDLIIDGREDLLTREAADGTRLSQAREVG